MPEKITFDCAVCAESFGNETDLNTHSLFTHNVYRGYCSTNSSSMNEKTATSVSDGIMKCLESLYRYILPEHISNQYDHIIVEFGYNKRYQKLNQKQKLEVKAKYVHDKIRNELGIPSDSILLLFLGRLNKDKGVLDLASAVEKLYLKKVIK